MVKQTVSMLFLLLGIIGCAQRDTTGIQNVTAQVVESSRNSMKENQSSQSMGQVESVPDIIVIASESERIVNEGKWGLSVCNPLTGVVEYYTSAGAFLARRMKN